MLKTLLTLLEELPTAVKVEFAIGIVMLAGAVGVEMGGVIVPKDMHMLFGVGGILMILFASYTNIRYKDRIAAAEIERQKVDVELQKARLAAGGSPDDDKTIMQRPG